MKIHSAAFVLVDIEEKGDDVRNALVSPALQRASQRLLGEKVETSIR